MKSNTKKTITIAVLALIVVAVIVGFVVVRSNAEKAIKADLPDIVDAKINALLDEAADPASNSDVQKAGLTEVEYEITDIDKEDGVYILTLEIRCTCDADVPEITQELMAYDVEDCFDTFEDFHIGKYHCRYYYGITNSDYAYEPLIYTYVNDALIHKPEKLNTSESKDTVECSACGREYKNGSDNANSIRMTSMCENCYANFKWAQEAQDAINNMPVD